MIIQRMHIALKTGLGSEEKAQLWVAFILAAGVGVLILGWFMNLAGF